MFLKKINLACKDLFKSLLRATDLFLIKLKYLPKESTIPLLGSYTETHYKNICSTLIYNRKKQVKDPSIEKNMSQNLV